MFSGPTWHVDSLECDTWSALRKFPAECIQKRMSDEESDEPLTVAQADSLAADRKRLSDFKAILDSSDADIRSVRVVIGKICLMVAEGVDRYI